MIVVKITDDKDGRELGVVRIERMGFSSSEFEDYSVQLGVDTGEGLATYQRSVEHFPRKKYNVLGLLRLALDTLEEKELTLDADPDAGHSSNLVRRLSRTLWPF